MKRKTAILDSSVWISSILDDDIFHIEALRLINRYLKRKFQIIIPQPVIVEMINVLSKKSWDSNRIRRYLVELDKSQDIIFAEIDNLQIIEYAPIIAGRGSIKSQDFYILIYCRALSPEYFETFDKAQKYYYNQITNN